MSTVIIQPANVQSQAVQSVVPVEVQTTTGGGYFERNNRQRSEIIEGLVREQQLVAFAGPFGVGKSPILADIAMHILSGSPWCGRRVERRPVIHFDLETPGPVYKANLRNVAARLGVALPRVAEELDIYLEHDKADERSTSRLIPTVKMT
jgi:RecA-family ATPase